MNQPQAPAPIVAYSPENLRHAVDVLNGGGVIALPTDTVYGVASSITNTAAQRRLYEAKLRPLGRALPVLLADFDDILTVAAEWTPEADRLAARFWPGPLTLVVPKRHDLPDMISRFPTVGIRMPDHPVALALMRLTGPLAVSSANTSGQPENRTALAVQADIGTKIDLIIDGGEAPGGRASTVCAVRDGDIDIIREGPIGLDALRAALGET